MARSSSVQILLRHSTATPPQYSSTAYQYPLVPLVPVPLFALPLSRRLASFYRFFFVLSFFCFFFSITFSARAPHFGDEQVFWQFLPLGVIAYGGPNAHIALLHERFVDKSKWLTEEQFVELMAVGQGLPGPTSTQASGSARRGLWPFLRSTATRSFLCVRAQA